MRLFAIGVIAAAMLTTSASAQNTTWYIGVEAGAEFDGNFGNGNNATTGYAILATIGRPLGSNFAVEGELGFRSTDQGLFPWFTQININQYSVMANLVYEFPVTDDLALHAGVGVGYDNVELGSPASISDTKGAVQLKLGLDYSVGETTDLVVNYRLMTAYDNTFAEIDNETVTVGLRFGF